MQHRVSLTKARGGCMHRSCEKTLLLIATHLPAHPGGPHHRSQPHPAPRPSREAERIACMRSLEKVLARIASRAWTCMHRSSQHERIARRARRSSSMPSTVRDCSRAPEAERRPKTVHTLAGIAFVQATSSPRPHPQPQPQPHPHPQPPHPHPQPSDSAHAQPHPSLTLEASVLPCTHSGALKP